MATLYATDSIAEMPIEQEDKGVAAMSSATTSSSGNSQASPRNTVSTTGTFVQLGSVEVSKSLQDGEKFVKWDEVSRLFLWTYVLITFFGQKELTHKVEICFF